MSVPPTTPAGHRMKRLFVFCDGTEQDGLISWEVAEDMVKLQASDVNRRRYNNDPITTRCASNAFRLSRTIKPIAEDGTHQIVMYQSGVAVPVDFEGKDSHLWASTTGMSVAAKIRDAYNFIVQNYVPGDEIYLFGFSRGAFTVRKVAGLLNTMGVLSKTDMSLFFSRWIKLHNQTKGQKETESKLGQDVNIRFLGVWDTVGSIRKTGLWELEDLLGFKDQELPANVNYARHAMAYHEARSYFRCTPFDAIKENINGTPPRLVQVWFPGVHSDVGGGYPDHQISDLSLLWMAGELKQICGVDLDRDFLDSRISPARAQLLVHYEAIPSLGNGSRQDIYQKTMKSLETTFCHRSMWAELEHSDEARATYWGKPAQRLKPLSNRMYRLNETEQFFWLKRWEYTIPDPKEAVMRGSNPWSSSTPPEVHPAPEEDEDIAALFGLTRSPDNGGIV